MLHNKNAAVSPANIAATLVTNIPVTFLETVWPHIWATFNKMAPFTGQPYSFKKLGFVTINGVILL